MSERDALKNVLPMVLLKQDELLDCNRVFGRHAPLFLEIGFGNGSFLFENAAARPGSDFIGIEIYRPGIAKLLKRLVIKENPLELFITNIRVFNHDARQVLINNIPPASLDGVYILFPDPWHKTRHHKRRLINPGFTVTLHNLLKEKGFAVVATDNREYASGIKRAFGFAGFVAEDSGMDDIPYTAYADKAIKKLNGVSIYRFVK